MNEEIEKSKEWVEDYVEKCNKITGIHYRRKDELSVGYSRIDELTYDSVMNHADRWVKSDDCDYFYVTTSLAYQLDDKFWHHYGIIRGKKLKKRQKGDFFACRC